MAWFVTLASGAICAVSDAGSCNVLVVVGDRANLCFGFACQVTRPLNPLKLLSLNAGSRLVSGS